ncbi:MAG: hypothetical protein SGPRY_003044 [Prymnesium sp.]
MPLASRAKRCSPPRLELPTFSLSLSKPLGVAFEESASGGMQVSRVLAGGSAERDGQVWPGDQVFQINGRDTRHLPFDDCMALLLDSPEQCSLTFGRERGRAAAVRLPGGRLVFSVSGAPLVRLAIEHNLECEFKCQQGTCGSCEMFLKDEETEEVKPVRMCVARIPGGKAASLMPWEVLSTSSPEAQQYVARLQHKHVIGDEDPTSN